MTSNALSTFAFNDTAIRVIDRDGQPWFVGNDICGLLGLVHPGNAYARLERSEILNVPRRDIGMRQGKPAVLVSESGFYSLVMRSDMPDAKPFQKWVTQVVLPAIRKDGGYILGEEKVASGEMSEDELVLKAIEVMQPVCIVIRCGNQRQQLLPPTTPSYIFEPSFPAHPSCRHSASPAF